MKKIIAAMVVAVGLAGGTASGADNVVDWVSGREPSHVWKNTDGSRTYRYDSSGTTTYRHRTSVEIQDERAALIIIAFYAAQAAYDMSCEFYEWQRQPEVRQQMVSFCNQTQRRVAAFFTGR